MSRIIHGLLSAGLCQRPKGIPIGRPRKATKKLGIKYEDFLAKALPFGAHGQWFEFRDECGAGHCQTDLLIRMSGQLMILEAKLTDIEAARLQLQHLYAPVVEKAFGETPLAIVVVRHLSALRAVQQRYEIHEAMLGAFFQAIERPWVLPVLHWRERTPIGGGSLVPQPVILKSRSRVAA